MQESLNKQIHTAQELAVVEMTRAKLAETLSDNK